MPRPWCSFLLLAACSLPLLGQADRQPASQTSPPETDVLTLPQRPPGPPPGDATVSQLERVGDSLRSQKAYSDAVEYYLAGLKKEPGNSLLYNKLGIAYLELNRLNEAQKAFQRSIKLDRTYPEPVNNLGVIYYLKKKYGKAIKEYEQALRLREDSASFHSNLGTGLFARKEYDKAAAEFARAMEIDPEIFERQSLAGVGLRMSSPEERGRYSYVMAKICAQRGMLDRSLNDLKKAIEEGYPGVNDAYKDNVFANLRKDPRFTEVMSRRDIVLPN